MGSIQWDNLGLRNLVKIVVFVDDLVNYEGGRFQVQQALARVYVASVELNLTVGL